MTKIALKIVNYDKVIFGLGVIGTEIPKHISDSLVKISNDIKEEMKTSMESSPASSRSYYKNKIKYFSSSPGSQPRKATGDLINSLEVDDRTKSAPTGILSRLTTLQNMSGEVEVGSTIFYAPYLEKGTRQRGQSPGKGKRGQPLKGKRRKGGKKMDARPFLKPAVDKNISKLKFQLVALVRDSLRKISV